MRREAPSLRERVARLRRRTGAPSLQGGFALALLLLVFLLARYVRAGSFGWYEDDLTIIPQAVAMEPGQLLTSIGSYIANLHGHARPLSNSMIYLFSNLGWRIAGLAGPYLIGFLIEAANIVLFYALIRLVWGARLAFLAGLAYVLFSADTTQAFLTHSLGLQPSITMLLLAFHAYLSKRWLPAYLLAFLILFSYETPFPVFLAVPLFERTDRRTLVRRAMIHAAILAAMLAVAYGVRAWVGEERVTGQPISSLLLSSMTHMAVGPVVSLGTYAYRPLQALASGSNSVLLLAVIGILVIVTGLGLQDRAAAGPGQSADGIRAYLHPIGVGMVMLILAYALALTARPYAISGRDTRVHSAAVVGAALVVGALMGTARDLAAGRRSRAVVLWGMSIWLGLMIGFGLMVQQDYVRAWELQRSFWRDLLPQVQDAGEGTVVIVDPAGLTDTEQIGANTWNLPRVLERLYRMPSDWKVPPRVYRGLAEWREYLILPDGSLRIDGDTTQAPLGEHTITDWDHLIVIHTGQGVVRRKEPLVIDAVDYPLVETGSPILARLPRLVLYDLLVGTDGALPAAVPP